MIQLDRGACRDTAGSVFFPEQGDHAAVAAAKRICAGCAVRLDCLALALHTEHLDGVWGGMTAGERAKYATPGHLQHRR
jgi:WhiB family redox-sensing transcriptional regulator